MDVKLINPFLIATKNVVEMMASVQVNAGQPGIKTDNRTRGEVSGLIGMAGEQVSGNMLLSFDQGSILGIVNNMLGEAFTSINDEVADAVGELTNMISGNAKIELNKAGYEFEMSLPVTIVGKNVEISQMSRAPILTIPFETEHGKFFIEAHLENKNKKS